jgi:mono/diheme cytochrome c family protein
MRLRSLTVIFLPALLIPMLMLAEGKGDAQKGKSLFSRCSMCHGPSGEGNEAIAKAYGVKIPALGSKEVQSLDDAALKKIIAEGKEKMQPVKMSASEMDDVIAFVRSLKKAPPK